MTDLGFARCSRGLCYVLAVLSMGGCFRGKLPPREFYRLVPVEAPATNTAAGKPPLTGSIFVASYNTPGIYGSGSIVYRVGDAAYGEYPSREWAIPLGEMLGAMTENVVRARGLTSGTVKFDSKDPRRDDYEWRASVVQFDEVDAPASVSASVSLTAQLVRAADDSVIWSGSASAHENVRESRQMASVVSAMSVAAVRAVTQLVDEAAAAVRGLAASGARSH